MRKINSSRLGKKGEAEFEVLCMDAELVCSKSSDDHFGWDFRVQFPNLTGEEAHPDRELLSLDCDIQVKTIYVGVKNVEVKLSAAERLAKQLKPSFVCVLEVGLDLSLQGLYLIHLIDQNLDFILKKIHIERSRSSLSINKKFLHFNHRRVGHKIEISGAALRSALLQLSGNDRLLYIKKKTEQIEELGFYPHKYVGSFSMKPSEKQEMQDVFLGIKPTEVFDLTAYEERWGVKKLKLNVPGPSRVFFRPKAVNKCVVIIRERDLVKAIRFEGELYPSATPPGLPAFRAFKVTTPFLQLVFDGSGAARLEGGLRDPAICALDVDEWRDLNRLGIIMTNGGALISLVFKKFPKLEFQVPYAEPTKDITRFEARLRIIAALKVLLEICGDEKRKITFREFAENSEQILLLKILLDEKAASELPPLNFEFKASPDVSQDLSVTTEVLLINRLPFIGNFIAYYAVAEASFRQSEGVASIELLNPRLRSIDMIGWSERDYHAYFESAEKVTGIKMSLRLNV